MGLEIIVDQMRGVRKLLPHEVNKIVQSVAIAAARAAIRSTRIDTGKAVSNWHVSLGDPDDGVRDAFAPGEKGSTAAANRQMARQEATAAIRQRKTGGGEDIYITNNVKYIDKLENLDSMNQLAEQAGKARLAQLVLKLK